MAHRSKDTGISIESGTRTKVHKPDNGATQTTYSDHTVRSHRRYFTGESIPNFKARVKRGDLLPHTSWRQVEWEARKLSGTFNSQSRTSDSWTNISNWQGTTLPVSYRIDDFVNKDLDFTSSPDLSNAAYMIQQAAADIYASGHDSLTFIGELPSLRKMFKKVGKTAGNLYRNRRIGRLSTKELLEAWVEGRYGFRTLAYDLRDLNRAVVEYDEARRIYTTRKGYSYVESVDDIVFGSEGPIKVGNLEYQLRRERYHNHSIRGTVTGRITPARFSFNPVRTAWELVPLSFVLDWAYDIGTAIEAVSFMALSQEYSASYGYRVDSTKTYTLTGSASSSHTGSASCVFHVTSSHESRIPSAISALPRITNRQLTGSMSLDLLAIFRLRSKLF